MLLHVGWNMSPEHAQHAAALCMPMPNPLSWCRLGRYLQLRLQRLQEPLGEQHCAMAIGLEVDTNVKLLGSFVEVFDPRGCQHHLTARQRSCKACRCAVRIGCLHDAELQRETCSSGHDQKPLRQQETLSGLSPVPSAKPACDHSYICELSV